MGKELPCKELLKLVFAKRNQASNNITPVINWQHVVLRHQSHNKVQPQMESG